MHLNSPVGVEKIQKKYVLNVDNISKSYSFKQYPAKNATFKCTQVLIFFFFKKLMKISVTQQVMNFQDSE